MMFSSSSREMTRMRDNARCTCNISRHKQVFFSIIFTIIIAVFVWLFFSRVYVDYSYNNMHMHDSRRMQVDRFTRNQEICRLHSYNRYFICVRIDREKQLKFFLDVNHNRKK